jgi:hemerythrin-like domain-containing protein
MTLHDTHASLATEFVRPDAPDLSGYLAIHAAMRTANRQLVAGVVRASSRDTKRAAALGRWFHGYSEELRTHHYIEDDILFPALAERAPAFADEYSAGLAEDHHHLDDVIDALRDAFERWASCTPASTEAESIRADAIDLAVELRDFLEEHLGIEDCDVLPLFERHFGADEYQAFEKQAGRAITLRQAMFTAPWYMASVDAATAARTLREAPLALKVVWYVSRRSYARLEQAAFGGAS